MNDHETLASALRWHTTHQSRLAASAKLYEHRKAARQSIGHYSSDYLLTLNVTEAKRVERAALRALAKVCANARGIQLQVCDAEVVELPMLMIGHSYRTSTP